MSRHGGAGDGMRDYKASSNLGRFDDGAKYLDEQKKAKARRRAERQAERLLKKLRKRS